MRFSSELLILIISIGIVGFNIHHFYLKNEIIDKSYTAKFLSYHPNLNQALYNTNSIITTKISDNNFVPLAFAEEEYGVLDMSLSYQPENLLPEDTNIVEGELVQPNADTLESLVAKQIKIYKTQSGDTLGKIAEQNNISKKTIMWANNLTSETIKPGWYLIILPTDGVLHKATSNNTLPDLEKKYGGNLETIISYNGLENAEDIDEGQLIIIPGGKIPEAPKPLAQKRDPSKVKPEGVAKPKVINNGTGHIFPWGYCTWYVATKVHVPWGGNAKNWLANAKAYGAVISNEPAVGAIVVTKDQPRYGHVAYIESVDVNGITVSEMNYKQFGKVNTRWISKKSSTIRGYIYP